MYVCMCVHLLLVTNTVFAHVGRMPIIAHANEAYSSIASQNRRTNVADLHNNGTVKTNAYYTSSRSEYL